MNDRAFDDSDAFVAAFLQRRLADRQAGLERTLDEYCALFPGREALVRRAWAQCQDADPDPAADGPAHPTVGPYRLLQRLGQGGQGEVWLGEDPRLGRAVAIKVLRGVAFASADALVRFRREAEVAARLAHPGICPVYDAGFAAGVPYLVMRHLDGQSLAAALPTLVPRGAEAPAQAERIARILERLARALHAAHTAGVLHRDVKPQNVMLTADDVPVLLDFGLARLVDDQTLFTRTGDRLGTPAYLAPEQLAEPPTAPSRATDVYGLGVVLHECLTGRRPFDAPTLDTLYRRILAGAATPAHVAQPAVPRDLSVIAATAMERDPHRRYATAEAMADDLRRWLDRRPILARPAGPWLRVVRWMERSPALALTSLALAVTLTAGLVVAIVLGQRASSLLGEWERLADRRRLDDLVHEADEALWPAVPAMAGAMQDWLRRAQSLAERLPAHRAALVTLQGDDPGHATAAERAWRRDQLGELVRHLEVFTADDPFAATIAGVRRRLARAGDLERLTLQEPAAAWQAAIARVATAPRYQGLSLRPQLGLVPLGPDPASGLEEFADPQTGDVPTRAADGSLLCTESTAVVFVLLPAGSFVMGAQKDVPGGPNHDPLAFEWEAPLQQMELAPFFLSKFELTQAQWQAVAGANPSAMQPGSRSRDVVTSRRHPVENVSWTRADTLARRCGWCLPTEAQWEYACRAGTTTPWSTGDAPATLHAAANLADEASQGEYPRGWPYHPGADDGHASHAPVGSFAPNGFGLHDMHGNVLEWCCDRFLDYTSAARPETGERVDPPAPQQAGGERRDLRINRGGNFLQTADMARSATRGHDQAESHNIAIGLRPARALQH